MTPRFVVYKASAGTGKTFTLVREYLRLAFDVPEQEWPNQFRRILAITFTNKAANEMKERVLSYLEEMVQRGSDCDMGDCLAKILGWDSSRLQRAAMTVRSAILHNYSDFAVSTIDRFMSRIIHTFARDLQLPVGFDVVTDERQLVKVSVDALLDLAGHPDEQDLSAILYDYLFSRMEEGKSGIFSSKGLESRGGIDASIRELAKDIFKEEVPAYLHQLASLDMHDFRELRSRYLGENKRLEQRVAHEAREVLQLLQSRGLTADMFYAKSRGPVGYLEKCAAGQLIEPNSYVTTFFSSDKHTPGGASASEVESVEAVYPRMEEAYNRIQSLLQAEMPIYNTRKELCNHLFQLALLNRIAQLVEQQYGEEEVIHISEFNKRIAQVVANEPMPFVYERIGSRYLYYLIDEFQDTSKMQWQNLLPLVANSVSQGGYTMVVGDAKQAIYRFRQGDVEQFVALPKVDNPTHGPLLQHPDISDVRRLETSFRSRETVVQFNNEFYRWLGGEQLRDNQLLYRIFVNDDKQPDLWQKSRRGGGFVSMDFWPMDKKSAVPVETMWNRVHEIIQQQVEEKGYRYRDIAILARKGKTLSALADYLSSVSEKRRPVPMVSVESFLLSNSTAVQLLRAAMLWVEDEYNTIAALQVLECLRRLNLLQGDYVSAVVGKGLVNLAEILTEAGFPVSRAELVDLPLYECCERLIRLFRLQDTETDYVVSMLGRVHEYCRRHRDHIGEFVEWFDTQHFSLSTSDEVDAVQLYTIHKAKGLEAPVVILVVPPQRMPRQKMWVSLESYRDQLALPVSPVSIPKPDTPLLYRKELDEEALRNQIDDANVLYVATTRPREKLFVLGGLNAGDEPYAEWLHSFLTGNPSTGREQVWRQLPVESGERYVCGDDGEPEKRSRQQDESSLESAVQMVRPQLHFAPWEEKVMVAEPAADLIVRTDDARLFGVSMHEILSCLTDESDVEQIVGDYCDRYQVPEEWQHRLLGQIRQLLAQPDSARFFDHRYRIINECGVMCRGEVRRPDRVLFLPDEVWVVDFKTGEPEAEYVNQVLGYRHALQLMGYEKVRAFLLYTETATVEEVRVNG